MTRVTKAPRSNRRAVPRRRALSLTQPGGTAPAFDLRTFLESAGLTRKVLRLKKGATVFVQGTVADSVYYLQTGSVQLSVVSSSGKEAVVGLLGHGDFFGEGCLAGQLHRIGTAKVMTASTVLRVPKSEMVASLHDHAELSDRFLTHMLARNIRIEEDLVDQLFNSSEKRLARTLLLLARYGADDSTVAELPILSQETLAEMIGTTRSRVNFFMNKFRRLGFIEYNGALKINSSLLSIVLHG